MKYKSVFLLPAKLLNVSLILFLVFSCTTMPEISEEDLALQGTEVNSINEIINLVETGVLKPQPIKITEGILDPPFYQNFNYKHRTAVGNVFKLSDVKIGTENNGFLRKEDPMITFPVKDDSIETYSFTSAFDIWQFEGIKGQKIDLLVRSLSTFPTGLFLPYFLLIDEDGKIIGRQSHILTLGKEKIKGLSIMVWIKDYIMPETGNYYLLVLSDTHKREDSLEIRIDNDRIPLGTAFENEGWIMISAGDFEFVEGEKVQDVYFEPQILLGTGGGVAQGKYHVILWTGK